MLGSELEASMEEFSDVQWPQEVKTQLPHEMLPEVPAELSQAIDFCAESLLNSTAASSSIVKTEENAVAVNSTSQDKPTAAAEDLSTKAASSSSRKRGAAKTGGGGGQKKVQKRDPAPASPADGKLKVTTGRKRRPARGALQALAGPEASSSIASAAGLASIVSAAASVVGRNVGSGDDSRSDSVLIVGFLRMQTHLFRLLRYTQLHFPEWADHEGSFLWHAANILGASSLVDLAAYRLAFEDATAIVHPNTSTSDWPFNVFFSPLEAIQTNPQSPASSSSSCGLLQSSHAFVDPIPSLDVFSVANCLAQLDNYRRKYDATFVPSDLRETIALHINRYPRAATAPASTFLSSAFISDPNNSPPPPLPPPPSLAQPSEDGPPPSAPAPPAYATRPREGSWPCKVPTTFGTQPWSSSEDEEEEDETREPDEGPPKDVSSYPGILGWFRHGRGQLSADADESSAESEPGDILAAGGLNHSPSNPGTLSLLSAGKRPWSEGQPRPATPKATGSPVNTPRTPEGAGDLEVKSAVRGVYYDETSKRWCASWHEKKSGKKRSRYFAVKKFGFMPAKKMATDARLEAEETGECAPTNLHGVEPA